MNKIPKVSVIMGVYNCGETLAECLDSLLGQSFRDFEVIICDDGSSDNSYDISLDYQERFPGKFILQKNERNLGLNRTLNKCLKLASGQYIARQDGDDISLQDRFEKQVDFLDNNHSYSIVSSAMIYFDEDGDWRIGHPIEKPLANDIPRGTPFAHAPCMVRREAYDLVGGYSEAVRFKRVEDYHLWIKMYRAGLVGYNLTDPLYRARDDRNAAFRRGMKQRINEFRVKVLAVKELGLPWKFYIYAVRPIVIAFIPRRLYRYLRKRKFSATKGK